MDKYIKSEKELAELLGFFDKWEDDTYSFNGSMKWARNNDEAFKLLIRYNLEINYVVQEPNNIKELKINKRNQFVQIRRYIKDNKVYGQSPLVFSENVGEHQDAFAATRYAIVGAVISILKENRSKIA